MGKSFVTDNPYKKDIFTVKKYGENMVQIAYLQSMRESGWEDERIHSPKCSVNDEKSSSNLSRAKNKIKEYALCNDWDWWCTFTVDAQKCDRYAIDVFYGKFTKFINNYNKRRAEKDKVKYLLVPEKHSDGAWHMHGFIKGIAAKDIEINKNGYKTWKQYNDKFGFISMDTIRDKEKSASYILKYLTKDTERNITTLSKHLYYCSKGLKCAERLYCGYGLFYGIWDWEHPEGFYKCKSLDIRKEDVKDYLKVFGNDSETEF